MALADRLRQALPGVHITTGGHFPSFAAAELLQHTPSLDSVVRGRGVRPLELARRSDAETTQRTVGDILDFRSAGRSRREQPASPLIADLDTLRFRRAIRRPSTISASASHRSLAAAAVTGLRLLQHPLLLRRQPRPLQRFRSGV